MDKFKYNEIANLIREAAYHLKDQDVEKLPQVLWRLVDASGLAEELYRSAKDEEETNNVGSSIFLPTGRGFYVDQILPPNDYKTKPCKHCRSPLNQALCRGTHSECPERNFSCGHLSVCCFCMLKLHK